MGTSGPSATGAGTSSFSTAAGPGMSMVSSPRDRAAHEHGDVRLRRRVGIEIEVEERNVHHGSGRRRHHGRLLEHEIVAKAGFDIQLLCGRHRIAGDTAHDGRGTVRRERIIGRGHRHPRSIVDERSDGEMSSHRRALIALARGREGGGESQRGEADPRAVHGSTAPSPVDASAASPASAAVPPSGASAPLSASFMPASAAAPALGVEQLATTTRVRVDAERRARRGTRRVLEPRTRRSRTGPPRTLRRSCNSPAPRRWPRPRRPESPSRRPADCT